MNYKNIITRISFLLALITGHAGMAAAAHSLSISDFSIKAGEEKTIEVNFTSDATDLYYVNGTIAMPEGIEVVVTGGLAQVATTSRTSGFAINMNVSSGLFRLTSLTKSSITGASGAIATIKVKAADQLEAGVKTIALTGFTVKHTDGTEEAATAANAAVTVEANAAPQPAVTGPIAFSPATLSLNAGESATVDVTMSGNVAMVDFEALFTLTDGLSIESVDGASYNKRTKKVTIDEIAADAGILFAVTISADDTFSGEGTVTLKNIVAYDVDETVEDPYEFDDITLAIGEPETETASFAFDYDGDLNLIPGETAEVPVTLTNGCALTGFQATLTLPGGMTAEVVKADRTAAAPSYNASTGNITCLGGISGKDGVLFTLRLTAGDALTDGTLTLSNLKATTASAHSIAANPASIALGVVKGTDNIAFAFSESEIVLAAGESTDVDVTLTNDRPRSGFQATLTLPEGISATLTKSDRLAADPTYRQTTGNITYLGGIEGNDGVLFTITLTASDTFAADGTITLNNLKTTTVSAQSSKADDIELSVKHVTKCTLNETSSEAIASGTYDVLTLKRTFTAGWNTVCLPFAVTSVTEFFGEGAKAYTFSGYDTVENTLGFTVVSGNALEAGKPYVVYVPAAIEQKELAKVEVSTAEAASVAYNGAAFVGTFAPMAAGTMTGLYGVTNEARIAKGGSEASMKGFRAYFTLPEGAAPARLVFNGGTPTGIDAMTADDTQKAIYNLNGQKLEKAGKGLVIVGGKKLMVK